MNINDFIKKYCKNCKNKNKDGFCDMRKDINNNLKCINYESKTEAIIAGINKYYKDIRPKMIKLIT